MNGRIEELVLTLVEQKVLVSSSVVIDEVSRSCAWRPGERRGLVERGEKTVSRVANGKTVKHHRKT